MDDEDEGPDKKKKRKNEEADEAAEQAANAEDPIGYYIRKYYNDAGSDENSIVYACRHNDLALLDVLIPYVTSIDHLTAGLFVPNLSAECCYRLLHAKAHPDGVFERNDAFAAPFFESQKSFTSGHPSPFRR